VKRYLSSVESRQSSTIGACAAYTGFRPENGFEESEYESVPLHIFSTNRTSGTGIATVARRPWAARGPLRICGVKVSLHRLKPFESSLGETRFRNGKTLTMNPSMALGDEVKNASCSTVDTALHTGDAVMKAPACDPA